METRIFKLLSPLAVIAFLLLNVTTANATTATSLSEDGKTLTISFDAAGDVKNLLTSTWNNTLPAQYSNIEKVAFSGPEFTNEEAALLYVFANGAANWSIIDLRKVSTISLSSLNANNRALDIYLPNGKGIDELNTTLVNYYTPCNIISLSTDETVINIASLSQKALSSDLSDLRTEDTKTIAYWGSGYSIGNDVAKSLDINGIKNISFNSFNSTSNLYISNH